MRTCLISCVCKKNKSPNTSMCAEPFKNTSQIGKNRENNHPCFPQPPILTLTLRPNSIFSFLLDNILKNLHHFSLEIKLEAHAEASF